MPLETTSFYFLLANVQKRSEVVECGNMSILSKIGILGLTSSLVLIVGYCIYFDRKRRSDPNFKQILKEKRLKEKKQKKQTKPHSKINELKSQEEIQEFFFSEIKEGERLLSTGDIVGGVSCLTNALTVCSQPQELLQFLQQSLHPQVFQLLLTNMMNITESPLAPNQIKLIDDELE